MCAGGRGLERDADGAARASGKRRTASVRLSVLRTRGHLRDVECSRARIGQCNDLSRAGCIYFLTAKAQACWRKADVGPCASEGCCLRASGRVVTDGDGTGFCPPDCRSKPHGDGAV